MLKKLYIISALLVLIPMSLLPMEKEAADVDDYTQAKEFHERLQYTYHGILQDGVRSYYKKIGPLTSIPTTDPENEWYLQGVSIGGKELFPQQYGMYEHNNISLTLNRMVKFNFDQPFEIVVTHNEEQRCIQLTQFSQKKFPGTNPKSYDDALKAMDNNEFSLVHDITLQGKIPGEVPCVISIKIRRLEPIILKGMEIVFCDSEKTTRIFLDLADSAHEPIDCFHVHECNYMFISPDKDKLVIQGGRSYKCDEKEVYCVFDSQKTESKWTGNRDNFYDLDNNVLTYTPSCFCESDEDHYGYGIRKKVTSSTINLDNVLHQVPNEVWEAIFLIQNKYATIEPNMSAEKKAAAQWCAMKNIVKTSLVCKRFNTISRPLLLSYTKEIAKHINELGGKDKAVYTAFTIFTHWDSELSASYWFRVIEIGKAMKANFNSTQYTEIRENTLLTQAIRMQDEGQIRRLIQIGTDLTYRNEQEEIPIDIISTYQNLADTAYLIKKHGGDPADKYEYINGTFVCKNGTLGNAYPWYPEDYSDPLIIEDLDEANDPFAIPHQTFSLASWLKQSPTYLFLAGTSASAVAYWLYAKYWVTEKNTEEEDNYLDADIENEEDCAAQPNVTYF